MSIEHFEDLAPGDSWDAGRTTLTAEEIVAFAERWDPQPFHVDPEAARASPFGGLVASGWHVGAACMRLLVEGVLGEIANGPALGVDELRWRAPVQPGDTLHVEATVERIGPWDEDDGLVHLGVVATNQREETVLTATPLVLVHRRE